MTYDLYIALCVIAQSQIIFVTLYLVPFILYDPPTHALPSGNGMVELHIEKAQVLLILLGMVHFQVRSW